MEYISVSEDFRNTIKEYVGKSEQERNKLFSTEKNKYSKSHRDVLDEYISKPRLWDLWNFLHKEQETIFGIEDWEIYRRAAGVSVEKDIFSEVGVADLISKMDKNQAKFFRDFERPGERPAKRTVTLEAEEGSEYYDLLKNIKKQIET